MECDPSSRLRSHSSSCEPSEQLHPPVDPHHYPLPQLEGSHSSEEELEAFNCGSEREKRKWSQTKRSTGGSSCSSVETSSAYMSTPDASCSEDNGVEEMEDVETGRRVDSAVEIVRRRMGSRSGDGGNTIRSRHRTRSSVVASSTSIATTLSPATLSPSSIALPRFCSSPPEHVLRPDCCSEMGPGAATAGARAPPPSPQQRGRSKRYRRCVAEVGAARREPGSQHRPCLDLEKMQQESAQSVTTWRPSAELSLFCW